MKRIKILLVEDEADIRIELAQFLQRYTNNELLTAENGEKGLELYNEHLPDIIVSDIKMPKKNGIAMVKEIKKSNPDQSVIFTTAHSDSSFFIKAIELQVDGYILKPIDLKLLDKRIKKINREIIHKRNYEMQKQITNEVAHLQTHMLAVLDENYDPIFMNEQLLNFWNVGSVEEFKGGPNKMYQRLVDTNDVFYPCSDDPRNWIEQIQDLDPGRRIIMLKDPNNRSKKTYLISITYIPKSRHTIVTFSEITDVAEEKSSYQKKAHYDNLTQIYNREMFNKQLHKLLDGTYQTELNVSLIILDLDHFKRVNDTYGHIVGDNVLVEFADLIKGKIRTQDIFARWGGEEFVLLLPDTDLDGACILAENLRKNIEQHSFPNRIRITSSLGVACMNYQGLTMEEEYEFDFLKESASTRMKYSKSLETVKNSQAKL